MTLGEESIAFVRFACVAATFCLPRVRAPTREFEMSTLAWFAALRFAPGFSGSLP
jgi:hypothetical protein